MTESPRKKTDFRSRHRAASHALAHANAAAAVPIPEHPLICRDKPTQIETDAALRELIDHLRDQGVFAYDSEFIGELTYIPKLCVIQVATARRVGLIDPLADLDLAPFWQLLADDSVETIVHAGQQDIEPVWRHTGGPGTRFFDTQIAAGFLALAYPLSLTRLVEEFLGVKLPKGLTFTHWDQRPLSAMQLRYAADDVRYLPAVHAELAAQLNKAGHMDWARQEFDALCASAAQRFDPESQYLRIRGTSSLSPRNMAVLRELTIWRDQASREHDQPPRSFLRDEVLAELARSPVKDPDKLSAIKGLPRPVASQYGATIVEITAHALALPPERQPQPRPTDDTPRGKFNADALWAAFQCLCSGRGIDPALVASHQEVTHFHRNPDGSSLMQGWRRQAVGQPLLDLMQAKDSLRLSWTQGRLQAVIDEYIRREG
jgi:ribonuclease D